MRPVKTCSEKDVPQPDSRKKFYHENTKYRKHEKNLKCLVKMGIQ